MSLLKNISGLLVIGILNIPSAHAALILDRTRIIYNEGVQSVSIGVTNKSTVDPYIAQSWIEDSQGKKVSAPFIILPPLERIEAGDKTLLRVTLLPGNTLAKDKETVFYLNIREIPPKSNKVNALQIALHSKIKLFYRPTVAILKRGDNAASHLQIVRQGNNLQISNPTLLHITLVGVAVAEGKISKPVKLDPIMLIPGQSITLPFSPAGNLRLIISHMNDYGGQQQTPFNCSAGTCVVDDKQRSS